MTNELAPADGSSKSAVSPQTIAPHDQEIDLLMLLKALFQHKFKSFILIVASVIAAHFYLSSVRPLYTARAEVILEDKNSPIDLGEMFGGGAVDKELQTEAQVIQSRGVMRAVIEELDLLSDPEFNIVAQDDPTPAWRRWLREQGLWPLQVEWSWAPRITLADPPERERPSDTVILRDAIDTLIQKTSVGVIRDTTILWVTVEAWSPEKAARIANEIADAYIAARVQAQVEAQRFASEFIGEQVLELRQEVEVADAAVQAFRSENAIINAEDLEVGRFEEIETRYMAAQNLRETLEDRLRRLEAAKRSGARAVAGVLDDRRINALLAAGYDQQLRQEIARVETRLRNDFETAKRRESALKETRDQTADVLEQDSANLVRLRQLEREAAASQILFETFLARQKETAAQQDMLTADARPLNKADPPKHPSSPRKLLYYAAALFLGGGLALFIAILLEMSRNRFAAISELEDATGYPVLGTTPLHPKARNRSEILEEVRKKPNSVLVESIRNLRTSILLADVDNPPKVITVTSSVPSEGKSMTTVLLAMVTAQMGKRAIIVDADIRRRTLHETLGVESNPGLISVLNGSVTLEEAVKIDNKTGMHALPVERTRANAPDLLSSQAFDHMLALLRANYDLVLLDAPPILPVTDARILAKKSDALVYVVKWNDTPKDIVKHGLASLASIGATPSGLVMTQVDHQKQRRMGYGHYGSSAGGSHAYYKKAEVYYSE